MSKKARLVYFEAGREDKEESFHYIHVNKFNEESAKNFYHDFLKLNSNPEVRVIVIVVDSYGGDVYALLSMLDVIKSANKPVATIASGKAMSCGAVLLSAGDKGLRFAGPSAEILIHEVSSVAVGKNSDVQNDAKNTARLNKLLMRTLAENSGKKDRDFFIKLSKARGNVDLVFSAKQAKSHGLIDFIGIPELSKS